MSSLSLQRGMLDTGILLAARAGDALAVRFVIDLLHLWPVDMSQLTALTLMASRTTQAERNSLRVFLSHTIIHPITARIADQVYRIVSQIPPPAPLTADDAIVAATAIFHKLPLYTLDPARFGGVSGLAATCPY